MPRQRRTRHTSINPTRIQPMLVARSALSGIAGHYSGHPLRTRGREPARERSRRALGNVARLPPAPTVLSQGTRRGLTRWRPGARRSGADSEMVGPLPCERRSAFPHVAAYGAARYRRATVGHEDQAPRTAGAARAGRSRRCVRRPGATAPAHPVAAAGGDASASCRRAGLPPASPEGRPRGSVERSRLRQLARDVPLRRRHMDRYLEELEWRFNNQNNPHIFRDTPARIVKTDPMTYRQLVENAA